MKIDLKNKLTEIIVQVMQEKKAQDISVINLKNIPTAATDYFVLCSNHARRQIDAVAESIIKTIYQKTGELPWRQEGLAAKEWVLLDYIDVVAHIFQNEKRSFYKLESLWGDAIVTSIAS